MPRRLPLSLCNDGGAGFLGGVHDPDIVPVNTLVLGPGQYSFADFAKLGVPFTVLVLLVTTVMVPWLYPLH